MSDMSKPCAPTGAERGFTLVEMLVAMTILGIMMTLLFNGLQIGIRTWDSISATTRQSRDRFFAGQFIRRSLEEIQPVLLDSADGSRRVSFSGGRESLRFVGVMPHQVGDGGLHWMTLKLADSASGKQLILEHELFQPAGWERYVEQSPDRVVLLDGLEQLEFAYIARENYARGGPWENTWTGAGRLPALIRIRIRTTGRAPDDWTELLVAPRLSETQPNSSISTSTRHRRHPPPRTVVPGQPS